jgi:hypothetical protein
MKKKEANRQAKKSLGQVQNPKSNGDTDRGTSDETLSVLPLKEFLTFLGRQKDVIKVEANVNVKELTGYKERRERADAVVNLMWEVMSYRFLYVTHLSFHGQVVNSFPISYQSKYDHKRSGGTSTRYMYNCAQNTDRQHAPLKSCQEGVKNRDKESMETFDCSGWIHITLSDLSDVAFIKLTHCQDHIPYCPIDIPEAIEKYVQDNLKLTPTQASKYLEAHLQSLTLSNQLWTEILKAHPKPSFTRKSIYQLWSRLSSCTWKRDEDEVWSAWLLLKEFQKPSPDRLYTVEPIPVEDEEKGITVIAFALPENLRQWGGRIRELQMDSACEFIIYPLVNKVLNH